MPSNPLLHLPTILRIATIILVLGLIGHIYWLQRFKFTDDDIQEMFGAKIFRTTIDANVGQELLIGKSVDGLRSQYISSPINSIRTNFVMAISPEGLGLTVRIKDGPEGKVISEARGVSVISGTSTFSIDAKPTAGIVYLTTKENDGSAWVAEWDEEINGTTKHVRFGYWLK